MLTFIQGSRGYDMYKYMLGGVEWSAYDCSSVCTLAGRPVAACGILYPGKGPQVFLSIRQQLGFITIFVEHPIILLIFEKALCVLLPLFPGQLFGSATRVCVRVCFLFVRSVDGESRCDC